MNKKLINDFLKSFFGLFKGKVQNFRIENSKIFGTVTWPDENENDGLEKQDFKWNLNLGEEELSHVKELIELISSKKLNDDDKILIGEQEIITLLREYGWDEKIAQNTLNILLEIEIKMIDYGEETDSFCFHF
jgi:hypothetical protein